MTKITQGGSCQGDASFIKLLIPFGLVGWQLIKLEHSLLFSRKLVVRRSKQKKVRATTRTFEVRKAVAAQHDIN
jgi:hypothetical protein